MNCPKCRNTKLEATSTTTGVELDNCRRCDSVWMDKGEIFLHISSKDILAFNDAIESAIKEDCVGEPPGELITKATAGLFLSENNLSINLSIP